MAFVLPNLDQSKCSISELALKIAFVFNFIYFEPCTVCVIKNMITSQRSNESMVDHWIKNGKS